MYTHSHTHTHMLTRAAMKTWDQITLRDNKKQKVRESRSGIEAITQQ